MEVRVLKMCFTQLVEKKKRDLRCQQCITKRMVHLGQESKSIETMFGQSRKLNIDLDMLRRKYQEEQVFHFILRELEELFQKL